ncbi:myb-binding protein 1A-like protein isoform X2 [Lingula anatina]|uniref:Myb-binding protein 1A-like protein isoform X2 n=1 Tax=Lingula anatina TaxID=7574 RepID=A0A1S3H003_LINAN|nr:myb-binding protein 1A-like protein isoform X2 [Lingula anatina]|eukprot:XP_013379455.1 myb-binding protein 1A-like protein isoform X2 [Lingula anatina]
MALVKDETCNAMEQTSKAKPSVGPELLQLFWDLADNDDKGRIAASVALLSILKASKKKDQKESELNYTVQRLVRGLSSSRKFARPGYTLALTQILRQFKEVTVAQILKEAKEQLRITKQETKAEQGHIYLGQVLGYLALIQADRLNEASKEEVQEVTSSLKKLSSEKSYLRQICYQALAEMGEKVPKKRFAKTVFPILQQELAAGMEQCTADSLLLLLKLSKSQPKVINEDFLKEHWKFDKLINSKNISFLADVMMQSTQCHPVIHSVCVDIVKEMAADQDLFSTFWKEAIDDTLLEHHQPAKKYLAFHLVKQALHTSTSVEMVKTIMSPRLISLLLKTLPDKSKVVCEASKQLANDIVNWAIGCQNGDLQLALLTSLLSPPGLLRFDDVTKTKTVATISQHLTAEATKKYGELLIGLVQGKKDATSLIQSKDRESTVSWAASQLRSLVTTLATASNLDVQLNLLQFLFLHAFFDVQRKEKSLPHAQSGPCSEVLSAQSHRAMQDNFFKALNNLNTFNPDKTSQKEPRTLEYIEISYQLVLYAKKVLANSSSVVPVKPFSEQVLLSWQKMSEEVEKIHKKTQKCSKLGEEHAFELLFVHLGLQLLVDEEAVSDVLKDLHICYEKSCQRRKKGKAADGEPEWVEVITEILLSLLSQPSHLVRVVVSSVFRMLCPHMTTDALQLIIDVLKSTGKPEEEEEGPLDFKDSESEEFGSGTEASETLEQVEEDEEESSSEEEEEEEEEEEMEEDVDENFKATVKAALGDAAAESDEESDGGLSDSAMFRLDEALAEAFRSRVKGKGKKMQKEQQEQLLHFKMRVLDLVEVLVHAHAPAGMLLEVIIPLFGLIESGSVLKPLRCLAERATHLVHVIFKIKKPAADNNLQKESLPGFVRDIIQYSAKAPNVPHKDIASACIFVLRVMLGLEHSDKPSPMRTRSHTADVKNHAKEEEKHLEEVVNVIKEELSSLFEKRDNRLNQMMFHSLLERQPILLWPVAEHLLSYAVNADIRVFCRTRALSSLAAMINKNVVQSIGEDKWSSFSQQLVSKLTESLVNVSELKPRYIQEAALVLVKYLHSQPTQPLPDSLLTKLESLKSQLSKDTRKVIQRVLGAKSVNRKRNMQDDTGGDKSPKKKQKIQGKNGVNAVEETNGTSSELHENTTKGTKIKKKKPKTKNS